MFPQNTRVFRWCPQHRKDLRRIVSLPPHTMRHPSPSASFSSGSQSAPVVKKSRVDSYVPFHDPALLASEQVPRVRFCLPEHPFLHSSLSQVTTAITKTDTAPPDTMTEQTATGSGIATTDAAESQRVRPRPPSTRRRQTVRKTRRTRISMRA